LGLSYLRPYLFPWSECHAPRLEVLGKPQSGRPDHFQKATRSWVAFLLGGAVREIHPAPMREFERVPLQCGGDIIQSKSGGGFWKPLGWSGVEPIWPSRPILRNHPLRVVSCLAGRSVRASRQRKVITSGRTETANSFNHNRRISCTLHGRNAAKAPLVATSAPN
jgi:hypothetical protein